MPKEAVRKREIKKNMRYIQSGRCKISCINTKLLTIQSLSRLSDLIKKDKIQHYVIYRSHISNLKYNLFERKRMERIYHVYSILKRPELAILILHKIDFKTKILLEIKKNIL